MPTIYLEAVISCVILFLKSHKFKKQPWPEYHMINYFLTKLAQAILRNIAPWSFLYGPRCAPSLVPQCSTNIPQYGPPARLVRA